jgi:sterol desaturase/sphingolipid hydroxylase (fatty acid hydroxylase superfamily)
MLASWLVWPVLVVAGLGATAWGFAAGIDPTLWAVVTSTAITAGVVAAELLVPRRPGETMFTDAQTRNDIGHSVLVGVFSRNLAWPLAATAVGVASTALVVRPHGIGWPRTWPLGAQVVVGLTLWSFGAYWTHRWYHRSARLWRLHAVHHDLNRMHVLKGGRVHVAEDLVTQTLVLVPLCALGAPTIVLVWIAVWNNVEGALAHGNVEYRFPAAAHWLLPTPALHLVHHSVERDLQGANLSGVTPLWDVIFGTFRHPDRHPVDAVGIDEPLPSGFLAQLTAPAVGGWWGPNPVMTDSLSDAEVR